MRINFTRNELESGIGREGLEVSVSGFLGDSSIEPCQVFIEWYDGKLQVHVWDGSSEDPSTHIIKERT